MHIGVLITELAITDSLGLKDKRRVVKSLTQRARAKFNVSVAELGRLDSWRHSIVGFACISNDRSHANEVLDTVADWVEADPRVAVEAISTEFL